MKLGLFQHILPRFNTSLSAFTKFKDDELTKVTNVGDKLKTAKARVLAVSKTLTTAVKRFRLLQEECKTTLKNSCGTCISSACRRRKEFVCKPTVLDIVLVLDPCQLGGLVCRLPTFRVILDDDVIDTVKSGVDFLVDSVQDVTEKALKGVEDLVLKTVPDVLIKINGVGKFLRDNVFEKIRDGLEDVKDFLTDGLEDVEDFLTDDLVEAFDDLGDLLGDIGSDLEDFVVDVVDDVGDLLDDLGISQTMLSTPSVTS